MESEGRPEDALAVERAAVAPWINQPDPPWWYMPSFALLMGALVLVLGERATVPFVGHAVLLIAIVVLIGAWCGAVIRHRGVMPRLRNAPPEFVPVIRAYVAGYALLLAVVVTVYVVVDSRVAAAVAAVGTWAGMVVYEKRFAVVADVVRRRVG